MVNKTSYIFVYICFLCRLPWDHSNFNLSPADLVFDHRRVRCFCWLELYCMYFCYRSHIIVPSAIYKSCFPSFQLQRFRHIQHKDIPLVEIYRILRSLSILRISMFLCTKLYIVYIYTYIYIHIYIYTRITWYVLLVMVLWTQHLTWHHQTIKLSHTFPPPP